jgi:hypothetical protein
MNEYDYFKEMTNLYSLNGLLDLMAADGECSPNDLDYRAIMKDLSSSGCSVGQRLDALIIPKFMAVSIRSRREEFRVK